MASKLKDDVIRALKICCVVVETKGCEECPYCEHDDIKEERLCYDQLMEDALEYLT